MHLVTPSHTPPRSGSEAAQFDYVAAARGILPRLADTSDKSERLRRLDDDAAAALRKSGLSRLITPRQFGGFELSPSAHILTCAELARACSAASWVLMVCVAHDYIVGRFPEECQKDVYEGNADNLVAGALAPQGNIERTAGGWRLNGRWQFGSGCDHSPWFILGARVADPAPDGYLIYHLVVPRADIEMDDTWHTLGMRGTGSKDLIVQDVLVPDHRAMPTHPTFLGLSPHAKAPTYRLPVYAGLSSMLSGSVLGTAERGLNASSKGFVLAGVPPDLRKQKMQTCSAGWPSPLLKLLKPGDYCITYATALMPRWQLIVRPWRPTTASSFVGTLRMWLS